MLSLNQQASRVHIVLVTVVQMVKVMKKNPEWVANDKVVKSGGRGWDLRRKLAHHCPTERVLAEISPIMLACAPSS